MENVATGMKQLKERSKLVAIAEAVNYLFSILFAILFAIILEVMFLICVI